MSYPYAVRSPRMFRTRSFVAGVSADEDAGVREHVQEAVVKGVEGVEVAVGARQMKFA
ncbi:hypothetical protein [Streptomyces sp. R35]|uniref:Uncharacterized protein n=1 Tax=Streptomyces sp. R35 TaxID=3238630 RepID=A0AB39SPC6_9ACTN